jgi:biopolymer transport protein ExbB
VAPDFDILLDAEDEVSQEETEEMSGGDLKNFKVVTRDDISSLEVGDIYKNNTSYFKVTKAKASGGEGGSFVVQRMGGKQDPMRYYNRVSGLGPVSIAARETLLGRFVTGGPLMYPIAILLLGVIVIAINSGMVYRRETQYPASFVTEAEAAIDAGDTAKLGTIAEAQAGLLSAVCRKMVVKFEDSTEEDIRIRCESEAKRQVGFLRMPLRGLQFIAAVAPLLGLLGTVVGMIACFDSLAAEAASASKAQAMAGGIKVALLTTAFGLCVAVPSLFVYFVYNLKLNTIIADCEVYSTEFSHNLAKIKRQSA